MRWYLVLVSRNWWLYSMYCPLCLASVTIFHYALSGPFYDHLSLYLYGPCYWHTDFITPFMKPTLLSSLYIVVALHSGLDLWTIYISLCCRHGLHFVVVFFILRVWLPKWYATYLAFPTLVSPTWTKSSFWFKPKNLQNPYFSLRFSLFF